MNEKTITIRVPEDFHRQVKVKSASEGLSVKDYLIKLVEEDLKRDNK